MKYRCFRSKCWKTANSSNTAPTGSARKGRCSSWWSNLALATRTKGSLGAGVRSLLGLVLVGLRGVICIVFAFESCLMSLLFVCTRSGVLPFDLPQPEKRLVIETEDPCGCVEESPGCSGDSSSSSSSPTMVRGSEMVRAQSIFSPSLAVALVPVVCTCFRVDAAGFCCCLPKSGFSFRGSCVSALYTV